VHLSVAAIRQSIQVAALPSDEAIESGTQRPCNGADLAETHLVQPAVLDQGDNATRHSRQSRQVSLPQLAPDPHRSEAQPDALIIHVGMIRQAAYLPLTSSGVDSGR
jgi:hypothetical protein